MSKIVVIGANGQLGTDLMKVFEKDRKYQVSALRHAELDITDYSIVQKTISALSPDVVINTAAFHQVDKCEVDALKAFTTNTLAVKNLATVCKENDCTLVHFSTDYVFGYDQERKTPYQETDRPGPVNAYGVSKLAGEQSIQYIADKYFIIRVAGLFGIAGSSGKGGNFIETMLRLAKEKGVVKVKYDEFTTPTSTIQVAENVRELIQTPNYGLYHMTSQGECSWYEFTKEIFRQTGTTAKCQPIPSSELPTPARRPRYTVLHNKHLQQIGLDLMGEWQSALTAYLQVKGHPIK